MCDSGKAAVVVADRMITAGDMEFEQAMSSKIEKLTSNTVALTAGSALAHTELFEATRTEFTAKPRPKVEEVVEDLKTKYGEFRRKRAEERYFRPLGLTVSRFLENQESLQSVVVTRLMRSLEEAEYGGSGGLSILIAGVDAAGAHLHCVVDPGVSECFDALGFCAIGSGERHAESRLMAQGYTSAKPMKAAVYALYEAKKKAESAPGVGTKYTDLAIVHPDQVVTIMTDLSPLDELYALALQAEESQQKDFRDRLEQLPIPPAGDKEAAG
jgi:hypothetical protein